MPPKFPEPVKRVPTKEELVKELKKRIRSLRKDISRAISNEDYSLADELGTDLRAALYELKEEK